MAIAVFPNNVNGTLLRFYREGDNLKCMDLEEEPFKYVSMSTTPVVDLISKGIVSKSSDGEVVDNSNTLRYLDIKYISEHYEEYMALITPETPKSEEIKRRISLDDLGIVLENVEVVCADPIKIVARNSKNVTGEKVILDV